MHRRDVVKTLAAGSVTLLLPVRASAAALINGNKVSLRCMGDKPGARYLDGRTRDGTVGLAPKRDKPFTGTKWKVHRSGDDVWLECLGDIAGPRWLDGRTHDGSVGLAPHTKAPFTGTRWKVLLLDDASPEIVALQCMGNIKGPRYLDGRTLEGVAGLAPNTDAPYTGTKWQVETYPVRID